MMVSYHKTLNNDVIDCQFLERQAKSKYLYSIEQNLDFVTTPPSVEPYRQPEPILLPNPITPYSSLILMTNYHYAYASPLLFTHNYQINYQLGNMALNNER